MYDNNSFTLPEAPLDPPDTWEKDEAREEEQHLAQEEE